MIRTNTSGSRSLNSSLLIQISTLALSLLLSCELTPHDLHNKDDNTSKKGDNKREEHALRFVQIALIRFHLLSFKDVS